MDLFDDSDDELHGAPQATATTEPLSKEDSFDLLGWERVHPEVMRGLFIRRGYLSQAEQDQLESIIRSIWIRDGNNQGMWFGRFPNELDFLFPKLRSFLTALPVSEYPALVPGERCPRDVWADPRPFTQLIANYYDPGEGIKEHVDLRQFSEGIVSLSLLSPVPMVFRPVCKGCPRQDPLAPFRKDSELSCPRIQGVEDAQPSISVSASATERAQLCEAQRRDRAVVVWLYPGDLLVLQDEARWDWTHEIERKAEDPDPNSADAATPRMIARAPRISLTMRRHDFHPTSGRSILQERWDELSRELGNVETRCGCCRCLQSD